MPGTSDMPFARRRRWLLALLVIVLALAAVLRFRAIGERGLSIDEGLTARLAELPLPRLIPEMRKIEQLPPLYHLLMHAWIRLPGVGTRSEAMFRAPGAVFGLAAVAAIYLLGARVVGALTGVAAALLLAISSVQVDYSQDARPYSLFVLLALLACERFAALLRPLDPPSPGAASSWVGTAVALSILTALMLYTHLFGATVIAAQAGVLALLALQVHVRGDAEQWRAFRATAKAWLAAMCGAGGLFAPWAWVMWIGHGSDAGIRPGWLPTPDMNRLGQLAETYAGSWLLVVILTPLILVGTIGMLRARPVGAWLCLALVVCGVLVPLVLSVLLRPVFMSRYGLHAQAALLLLAAAGLVALAWLAFSDRPRAALGFLAALALAIVMLSLPVRSMRPLRDWRGLVADLRTRVKPGDVVVLPRWFDSFVFHHYVDRGAGAQSGDLLHSVPAIAYDDPDRPDASLPVQGRRVWWIVDLGVLPGERVGEFQPTEHQQVDKRVLAGLELRELVPGSAAP